ncbi:EAL domain-containing protein [Pseudomonas sp. SR9]|jgi:diguanylate cyclase (GGDEF)-like protein/PAS domain S-box-containing protein|uniref:cyclic-guanylate-specific phosphodiesterase n=2 Tax=Aquipseudomonas guryensis TaxID=2759165 RepID=A0A7W4H504_9GAMM|nr:EAL domain-containing protein [Pseudomonas guryensis]
MQYRLRPLLLLLCSVFLTSAAMAEQRNIKVGVYANEPKIMLNQDGQLSGILGDLLREIAQHEEWQLQPVACEWQQCLELTRSGQIDLMPDVAWNDERAQFLDFHKLPALFSWSQIYSQKDLRLNSQLDLNGRRIAVLAGSVQEAYLLTLLDSFGLRAELLPVQSLQQGFELVANDSADAVVANQRYGDYNSERFGLRSTPIMFQPARLFFATRKDQNGDLLAAIDAHLKTWQEQAGSPYYQIIQRWGSKPPQLNIPPSLWWALATLTMLLLLALGGTVLLRRQVARQTRDLSANELRLNTILDSVEAYIYIKDPQLRYQYVNRKVCELFGKPREQVLGHTDSSFFDEATVNNLRSNDLRVLQQGERVQIEEVNRSADGRCENAYLSVKLPLHRPDGSIYALCGISTDITEHKRNLEQIHQLAFFDSLTGLPNRRLLQDRLQHALAYHARTGQQGALLFIDLDNFKTLNDTLGHAMGDLLLQQVALRLRSQIREEDSLARLGGDEFVLMLERLSTDPAQALMEIDAVGNKLLLCLAAPYDLQGHEHTSTASIGVALFSDSHSTVEELLKRADLAMYEAKAAGRNALRFFNQQMQTAAMARIRLETDMRHSIAEQHFLLHYQPQVDQHGQLIGAEALVRWQHPQHGLIAPGEFIPVAESTDLILPLGRWILQAACQQLVTWSNDPELAELPLAVNVSARQLHHPHFVADVLAILAETGANPERLELELTESHLAVDIEEMIRRMQQLQDHGVRFSLDDFGTGYSSLGYLKRLPLSRLKIDRCFVRDLLSDANDAAIVRTIVALGQSLDLQVIAEGVETVEQRDALLQSGCSLYQGYLFAKPGPAADLQGWVADARCTGSR